MIIQRLLDYDEETLEEAVLRLHPVWYIEK